MWSKECYLNMCPHCTSPMMIIKNNLFLAQNKNSKRLETVCTKQSRFNISKLST